MKKALILMGSGRKGGNTDLLSESFADGVRKEGHTVEKIYLLDKRIGPCLGCGNCQQEGASCVQKDDMLEIYEKILAADAIVLASPIYYDSWTGLMKLVLDRTTALEKSMKDKQFYLLSACGSGNEEGVATMKDCFEKYVGSFAAMGNRTWGSVFGFGTDGAGDIKGTSALKAALEMGKSI